MHDEGVAQTSGLVVEQLDPPPAHYRLFTDQGVGAGVASLAG